MGIPLIGAPAGGVMLPFIGIRGIPLIGVPAGGVMLPFIGTGLPLRGTPAGGVVTLLIGVLGVVPLFVGVVVFGGVPLSNGMPIGGVVLSPGTGGTASLIGLLFVMFGTFLVPGLGI
jgi:hypothetical protein